MVCVCLQAVTGYWSHCSQVKVTVNKWETKPERRRHLTVCECEKNRETGREKKTDTRRRKIPINWSPVCFKKRDRNKCSGSAWRAPFKKTKQERSPDWVTDKNIAVLCCEEERAGGGGEREREGRALKGGRWRQVYGRPVAWRNPLNLLSLSHTHERHGLFFTASLCSLISNSHKKQPLFI